MSKETSIGQSSNVQQSDSSAHHCHVCQPQQQTLSPQEIERICKAFIRLILAKEIPTHAKAPRGNNAVTNDTENSPLQ